MPGTDENKRREETEEEKSGQDKDEPGRDESVGNGTDAGGKGGWDDPLRDIVERTRPDPGAFFRTEDVEQNLAAAWRLKKDDMGAWITLRRQLGKAGCPLRLLDAGLRAYDKVMRQEEKTRRSKTGTAHGNMPAGYAPADGMIHRIVEDNEGRTTWVPVCVEFHPLASTRDVASENWGTCIEFRTQDGHLKRLALPRGDVASDPSKIMWMLGNAGFFLADVSAGTKAAALDLLHKWRPQTFVRAVDRIGWTNDCTAFILGSGEVLGASGAEEIVFQPQRVSQVAGEMHSKGSLDEWRTGVASLAPGNHVLTFAICMAFAGPLLEPMGLDGSGIHLRGQSSLGKTTALHVAASVWGSPKIVMNWRTTANGLEGNAALFSSTVLLIDEIGQVDGREAAATVYMLAAGRGKSRADRTGAARPPAEWRTLVISSGEIGLSDKVAEAGRVVKAGQEVRLLDLPVTGRAHGVFDRLYGYEDDPAAFANYLRNRTGKSHGTAGPAFVAALLADPDFRERVTTYMEDFRNSERKSLGFAGDNGQARRAVDVIGLVVAAGRLAAAYGITGWPENAARDAGHEMFDTWIATRGGTDNLEIAEALTRTQDFLNTYSVDRFEDLNNTDPDKPMLRGKRAGWKDLEGFWILPPAWREIHIGSDATTAARILHEKNMLVTGLRNSGNRHLTRRTPRQVKGRPRAYFIRQDILGLNLHGEEEEPEQKSYRNASGG